MDEKIKSSLRTRKNKKIKELPPIEELERLFYYKDGFLYNKINRNSRARKDKKVATGYKERGYLRITINWSHFFVHRIIWALVYKKEPQFEIDHINRIRDDNRIENLRDVTHHKNRTNRDPPVGCIHFSKRHKLWLAYGTGQKYLGWHKTYEAALAIRSKYNSSKIDD